MTPNRNCQACRSLNGGYVEAGWNITGQPFRYNVGSAAFARPTVDDPFIINENGISPGIGVWQLGAVERREFE
jgi:hypothetical protein